jgi:hypothetical protein
MFIIFIVYGGMELPSYDKITVSLRQVLYCMIYSGKQLWTAILYV